LALGAIFSVVKWPRSEADPSPSSSAEVKNGGAIPPLHDRSSWNSAKLIKQSDNFAFYYLPKTES
jgi:hypothetical protein